MSFISARRVAMCFAYIFSLVIYPASANAGSSHSLQVEPNPVSQKLRTKYAKLQRDLLAKGRLRTDVGPAVSRQDHERLENDFMEIALFSEYGSGLNSGPASKPLLRWETPVRLRVIFGASVGKTQKREDLASIRKYSGKLSRATGHPISLAQADANLIVLVVNEAERQGLAKQLPKLIPGISKGLVRNVAAMQPNHLCMVVADPHRDRALGYKMAIAIVRAEHTGRMRNSCIEEELAQGMGLPNDCPTAHPSIFNDNEEFAVLTRRDELMLKMLYDPSLKSGMTATQAQPMISKLARRFQSN